jgi:hypothetical protein
LADYANRYVRDLTCDERMQRHVEPLCDADGGGLIWMGQWVLRLAGQSPRDLSPINHETLPGNESCVVRGEKGKESGHVLRAA